MRVKKGKQVAFSLINWISSILPVFFWTFLIFGFEEPHMGVISILAALVHECGHILCILWRSDRPNLRSVISGFRISSGRPISYAQEITTYLAGPMANLLCFVLLSLIASLVGEWAWDAAIINLATALSNLLPIEGYDGYGTIRALLQRRESGRITELHLKRISSALTFLFAIISLYLMDRLGGGYWIFAIFFISTIKCIREDLGE